MNTVFMYLLDLIRAGTYNNEYVFIASTLNFLIYLNYLVFIVFTAGFKELLSLTP